MDTFVSTTPIAALAILLLSQLLGDFISTKTKAFVPSMLVFVIIILACVWTGIAPDNLVEIPGFTSAYASGIILMFLVDMGSSISPKQLKVQWRTVLICLAAMVVIALIVIFIGGSIFGKEYAMIIAPPLCGGVVAGLEMMNAALALGNAKAAGAAALILAVHSLPGFILMPVFLKRVCKRTLNDSSMSKFLPLGNDDIENKNTILNRIPQKYKSMAYYLGQLAILAVIANSIAGLFGGKVSPTVFALALGFICSHLGIIEKDCMEKSGSKSFLMWSSLITVFSTLFALDQKTLMGILGLVLGLLLLGIIGIFLGSGIMGKLLKVPKELSFSLALNCLLGFPMNYMLTVESVKAVTDNTDEREKLMNSVLPAILIAGFVTVTIGSVVFASIMKNSL